jgi:hypothetical protein
MTDNSTERERVKEKKKKRRKTPTREASSAALLAPFSQLLIDITSSNEELGYAVRYCES